MRPISRNTHMHQFYLKHSSVYGINCFYCNEWANTIDHVPPLSSVKCYPNVPKILVKACVKCNYWLSAKPLPLLSMRAEYLLKKYKKKYKNILKRPIWYEEEINELNGSLKQYIIANKNEIELAKNRILYLENNLNLLNGELNEIHRPN